MCKEIMPDNWLPLTKKDCSLERVACIVIAAVIGAIVGFAWGAAILGL